MITFIQSEPEQKSGLTLASVRINQFFVDDSGYLCQKVNDTCYNVIADEDGEPYACYYEDMEEDSDCVTRILPNIEKISF